MTTGHGGSIIEHLNDVNQHLENPSAHTSSEAVVLAAKKSGELAPLEIMSKNEAREGPQKRRSPRNRMLANFPRQPLGPFGHQKWPAELLREEREVW